MRYLMPSIRIARWISRAVHYIVHYREKFSTARILFRMPNDRPRSLVIRWKTQIVGGMSRVSHNNRRHQHIRKFPGGCTVLRQAKRKTKETLRALATVVTAATFPWNCRWKLLTRRSNNVLTKPRSRTRIYLLEEATETRNKAWDYQSNESRQWRQNGNLGGC